MSSFGGLMTQIAEAATPSLDLVTERNHDAGTSERLWIVVLGAMVVIQLWFGMISTSFWLDETGTWWIVKDGVAEAVRRSISWSGQSPLYYLIAWCSSRLFGLNEIGFRIPSVLAMSGAIYFLYRIAERIYDRASAAVAAFVFLCAASFYAIDARPYALAMLCLTASTWVLLRWVDTNRPLDAVFYAITAALVVYAHCIMSLGLGAGVIYAVVTLRKEPRRLAWLGLLQAAVALLSIPVVPELRMFYATRSVHTLIGLPRVGDILNGFIPCSVAGVAILLAWIYMSARGEVDMARKCTARAALLVGSWALFAPLFLFLLQAFADLRLFVDPSALPGQALLAGGLLSSIRPPAVRKALLLVLGAASIFAQGRLTVISHGHDDWRSAMTFLKKEAGSAPVLLVSPFAEATDFKSLSEPKIRDVLFAPELLYGEPIRSIRLPNLFASSDSVDLENVAQQLKNEGRFFLVNDKPDANYEMWLLGRFGARCKSVHVDRNFGDVWIARFICRSR